MRKGGFIIPARKYKKKLTIENLIFLHLLDNNDQSKYIVNELITEKGIQKELDCSLSYVSRILKKLEEEGYVYRRLMRIENKKQKQKAVYLTDEGLKLAEKIREKNSEWIEKRK